MKLEYNKSLLNLNSFHIDESANEYAEVNSETELHEILDFVNNQSKSISIIGGGSNILLTQNVAHLVLQNKLMGVEIVHETDNDVEVRFMSGENWHHCVNWCVERNFGGLENLSLIPGTIGAAPIQNIGAYGVELKDVFVSLEAIHIKTLQKFTFLKEECAFGYRDSFFKSKGKNTYFITSVTLRLQKQPSFQIEYGDIKKYILEDFQGEYSIKNISKTVIKIRTAKLPNPDEIGNAGSFFKNPVITTQQASEIKTIFPEIPCFEVENGVKIPAAWLIEQCNWKGYKAGKFGVHQKQALVLVNYADAKGADILALSSAIVTSVQQRFNIVLEREVNIW